MTTVGELKEICERILDQLEGWEDDDEVMVHNTSYFLGSTVLETKDGYIDCFNIEPDDEEEEEY